MLFEFSGPQLPALNMAYNQPRDKKLLVEAAAVEDHHRFYNVGSQYRPAFVACPERSLMQDVFGRKWNGHSGRAAAFCSRSGGWLLNSSDNNASGHSGFQRSRHRSANSNLERVYTTHV
jgi:hypothetical protein